MPCPLLMDNRNYWTKGAENRAQLALNLSNASGFVSMAMITMAKPIVMAKENPLVESIAYATRRKGSFVP